MASVNYYWSTVSGKCYRWVHEKNNYGIGIEEKIFIDPPEFQFDVGGGRAYLISFTTSWDITRRNIEHDMIGMGIDTTSVYIFDPAVNPYWHSGHTMTLVSKVTRHCGGTSEYCS